MDYMTFADEGGARRGIEPVVTGGVCDERLGPGGEERRGRKEAVADGRERGVKRIEECEMARFFY